MNLNNIPQKELIYLFKEIIEKHEKQAELFSDQYYEDIMLDLVVVKMNLDKYKRESIVNNQVVRSYDFELEMIDSALDKLKNSFREILSPLPRLLGLAKAIELYTKEFALALPITIDVENNVDRGTELPFSPQEVMNIFRLYDAVLNHFILQPGTVLNIVIALTDKGFCLEFKKLGEKNQVNMEELKDSFFTPNFKEIKARSLMAEVEILENADWETGIKLFIPFRKRP